MLTFTHSPFLDDVKTNEEAVRSMVSQNDLSLPDNPHFVTHLNEFSSRAMRNLCNAFCEAGCPDGVWTYSLRDMQFPKNRVTAVTRLDGLKMGNTSLKDVPRVLVERGANRPPQPVIISETPFRPTEVGTIICFGGCIYTIHSGPEMPASFDDEAWTHSALCYRADEVEV